MSASGGWYKVNTRIADRVSAELGGMGLAVYDTLCRARDNDTDITTITPERIAARIRHSDRGVRSLLSSLVEMGAAECVLIESRRAYRVNLDYPEKLIALPKTKPASRTRAEKQHDRAENSMDMFETCTAGACTKLHDHAENLQRNKEELDSTAKPVITNPQVLHTSSRGDFAADARAPFLLDCIKTHFARANGYELTPAHEMTLSGAVFDALLNLPLPYWSNDKLSDAVANFFASQRSKTQDPMSPPAKWVCGLYRYRDGPLDAYGKPIEFTDPQEAHGTAGIEIIGKTGARLNAHQLRTANSLRAAAGAFRYFDRIEQAEGDRGGTDEVGGAHPREPG